MPPRAAFAALLLALASCGGPAGFQRPDYAAQAEARCDEAESQSDPNRALALFGLALEANPKMARAFYGRALIFEQYGRHDEAERSFSMAAEYAADDVKSRYLLGRARYLRRRARIESSVRDLDRAVALLAAWPLPEVEAEVRLLRAECRIQLRGWIGALEDLDAAEKAGLDSSQRDRARSMRVQVDAARTEERR